MIKPPDGAQVARALTPLLSKLPIDDCFGATSLGPPTLFGAGDSVGET